MTNPAGRTARGAPRRAEIDRGRRRKRRTCTGRRFPEGRKINDCVPPDGIQRHLMIPGPDGIAIKSDPQFAQLVNIGVQPIA
jgi:hypothetical protein